MSAVNTVTGHNAVRPAVTPLNSNVLDHASVHDVDGGMGWTNDAGLWPSYNCLDLWTPLGICPTPSSDFLSFSFPAWVPGYAFAVYGGAQCLTPGLDVADMVSEVRRVFLANEGRGVEETLLLNRFIANAGTPGMQGENVTWAGPTDLTPAGKTITIHTALALLEGKMANTYAGQPTVHLPRAAATLLWGNGALVERDGKVFTRNGSKVAMGGGYDVSEVDGTWDLYATGEVYVERSSLIDVHTFTSGNDGSGTGAGKNNIIPNTTVAFAERMYRVALDCPAVLKATGTAWS